MAEERRGPGRPRKHPPQRYHATSVRIELSDLAEIDAVCARTGYSRNQVIRAVLRLGLKFADTIPNRYPGVALAPPGTRAAEEVGPLPPGSGAGKPPQPERPAA